MSRNPVYRCWFDDPQGQRRSVDWLDKGPRPCLEGFWVDEDWQLNTDLDRNIHWIPPARIVLVTRLPWRLSGQTSPNSESK
jgi:hypothetical protein